MRQEDQTFKEGMMGLFAVPIILKHAKGEQFNKIQEELLGVANSVDFSQVNGWSHDTHMLSPDTFNSNIENQVLQYFRDDTYDRYDLQSNNYDENTRLKDGQRLVGTASDFYKPLKGLPICNNLAPCPFYIPDDFVMLQVAVTPGQTEFRPGDQVDISSSEKYKIILADSQKDQNGLDNVNSGTAIGMLFCARIT